MSYYVTAYSNIDAEELFESESFDEYDEAMAFADEKAEELVDELGGSELEYLEGAPDFVLEISIEGTKAVVIVRDGALM